MNYGYDCDTVGWRRDKVAELAKELSELCENYEDKNGMNPYIEVDGLYPGIRLRRLTHLSDEDQEDLVREADKLFDKIMKGELNEESDSKNQSDSEPEIHSGSEAPGIRRKSNGNSAPERPRDSSDRGEESSKGPKRRY